MKEFKNKYKEARLALRREYKKDKKARRSEYKSGSSELYSEYLSDLSDYRAKRGRRPAVDPPKRALLEEIGNAVSHGIGSLFAIVAFILMLFYSSSTLDVIGAAVYFFGLFSMCTMSCLYHSFRHGSTVKRVFRRFDYSSIYLLIGATFAPVLICYIGGVFGWVFFAVQWLIIATGITLVGVFGPARLRFIHIPLYVILGWSALMLMPKMLSSDPGMFYFILGGGVIYSIGIIPFAIKARVSHFIWHIFVVAGTVVQWCGIFIYIYLPQVI